MLTTKSTALWILISAIIWNVGVCDNIVHVAPEHELFSLRLTPIIFNWTYQDYDKQYRFRASLIDKPDLPSWLKYTYSERHHSGFIYGTPPLAIKSPVLLEVVGLNRQDFETRRLVIEIHIKPKTNMAKHQVLMKIDSLNVEDLLDEHKMNQLKQIFSNSLWNDSLNDIHATYLVRAIDFGARLPLLPSQGEGVVVRLGSIKEFSPELLRLRDEVKPLYKLTNCPRDYKRTTVERLFRDSGFILDWCNFRLYNTIITKKEIELIEYSDETSKVQSNNTDNITLTKPKNDQDKIEKWNAPLKSMLPERDYTTELLMSITIPLLLMCLSMTALTAVLCCHYVAETEPVEICRYNVEEKNISDKLEPDQLSLSPNLKHSPRSMTNLASHYSRPEPPPYINKKQETPSTCSNITPEPNFTNFEESLKLLNDANINYTYDKILSSVDFITSKVDDGI